MRAPQAFQPFMYAYTHNLQVYELQSNSWMSSTIPGPCIDHVTCFHPNDTWITAKDRLMLCSKMCSYKIWRNSSDCSSLVRKIHMAVCLDAICKPLAGPRQGSSRCQLGGRHVSVPRIPRPTTYTKGTFPDSSLQSHLYSDEVHRAISRILL